MKTTVFSRKLNEARQLRGKSVLPRQTDKTDQHDDDVGVCVVPEFPEPPLHVLVGQVLRDVVHQQGAHGAAVVPE